MTSLYYETRLHGLEIDGSSVSCLGSQLVMIINSLGNEVKDWTWLVSDLDASQNLPEPIARASSQFQEIGTTEDLKQLAYAVDQFLSGVFLALPNESGNRMIPTNIADDRYNIIEAGKLVIRAFDTSYYEVCSTDRGILESLSRSFGVSLECRTYPIG